MKIYIAGPMSGLPELNYPAFIAAQEKLEAMGHEVENPAHNNPEIPTWDQFMRMSLRQISHCDAVYFLEGWMSSKGAMLEHVIASTLGMTIYYDLMEEIAPSTSLMLEPPC